jgi:hypothetical protein
VFRRKAPTSRTLFAIGRGNTRLPPNNFHSGVGVVLEAFPNKLYNYARFSLIFYDFSRTESVD